MRRNKLGGPSRPGANLFFRILFCWLLMGVTIGVLAVIGGFLGIQKHTGFMAVLLAVVVPFLLHMARMLKEAEGCLPGVFRLVFLLQSVGFSLFSVLCLIDLLFGGKGAVFAALGFVSK